MVVIGKAQELYVNSKDSRLLRYLAERELAKQTDKTEIFLGDENGIGIWSREDKQVFFGTFKDGELVTGEHLDQHGNHYVGQFKGGHYNGRGTMSWMDRTKYEGNFFEGQPHGKGVITHPNNETYQGDFFRGHKHGQCDCEKNPSGEVYKGGFLDDKKSGSGTLTYPNGDVYDGQFYDNLPHGFGVFTTSDGRSFNQEYEQGNRMSSTPVVLSDKGCCVIN